MMSAYTNHKYKIYPKNVSIFLRPFCKVPHKGGDTVNSYVTKIINDKLYVNSISTNIGKRVTQPHDEYSNLENSVKEYLNHMDKDSRLQGI